MFWFLTVKEMGVDQVEPEMFLFLSRRKIVVYKLGPKV